MLAYRKLHAGNAYRFKVLLGGEETVHNRILDANHFVDEGHVLHFEGLGDPAKGFQFNDIHIEPKHVRISNGGRMYTFKQQAGNQRISGHFEFVGRTGYGHITIGDAGYAVQLQPWAVPFDVDISMNAGAYYSTAKNALVWDPGSDAWKGADWSPHQLLFSYDTYDESDPIIGDIKIIECRFTDVVSTANPPAFMELTGNAGYTATMSGNNLLSISADNPPDAPYRANEPIRSAFPKLANFQFDQLGFQFIGAYRDKNNNVYAVKGRGQELLSGAYALESTDSVLSLYGGQMYVEDKAVASSYQSGNRVYWRGLASQDPELPVSGYVELSGDRESLSGSIEGKRTTGRALRASTPPILLNSGNTGKLDVYGLMGMNPMMTDKNGNHYDVVGNKAMNDYRDIILTYMDKQLREDFVVGAPPSLSPEVRDIANDNPTENAAFYKKLQVPFLVQALAPSTVDQAKYLNGARAGKVLKRETANNNVYKRHSDALYRHHWLSTFGNIVDYLNDQQHTDHTADIDHIFAQLTDFVKKQMEGAVDKDRQSRLDAIVAEMDVLKAWTHSQKAYWALQLYYYLTKYWMPTLQAKLKDGNVSQDVTQQIRVFSALFNVLEGTGNNPAPNGKTFNQAFMETLRAFQLMAVLPQYVDYGGDSEYFCEVLDSIFQQFIDTYGNDKSDPEIVKQTEEIQQFLNNRQLTKTFVDTMVQSLRTLGNNASWAAIANKFEVDCQTVLRDVPNVLGKARVVLLGSALAGFILVFSLGDYNSLSDEQKTAFIAASVNVLANILVSISQGAIRLYSLWDDFGGVWNGVKIFWGYEEYLAELPSVTTRVTSGFTEWFVRSQGETMDLVDVFNPDGTTFFSKLEVAFGRNMNEFMSQTFGAAMAVIGLVLSAIDLAHTTDPLAIAMDSLMVAATSLQLIATVGGWVLAAFGVTEGIMVNMCAMLGAAGAIAAIAGMIVMIVMSILRKDPPNPLRDFVNDQADKAKLKMPNLAEADYFNVVPDKDGKAYSGIAIHASDVYLQLKAMGGQASTSAITHKPDTVFFITTDEDGLSKIFTQLPDASNKPQIVLLGVDDNGQITSQLAPVPPKQQADGTYNAAERAAYEKKVRQQQWNCLCQGGSDYFKDKEKEDKLLMEASFTLQNAESKQYLALQQGAASMSASAVNLTLSMERIGPGAFTYLPAKLHLFTNATDFKAVPKFTSPYSGPVTWSITPPLPNAFEMLTDERNGGVIRQKAGVKAPALPLATYTVAVSSEINGQTYASETTLSIEVVAAAQLYTLRGGVRIVPGH